MVKFMKKLFFALLPALTVLGGTPEFEFSRFVNGAHKEIPASAGFSVKKSVKNNGKVTEYHLDLSNGGKETLLLRIRARFAAGNAGGAYWDGNLYTRNVKETVVPKLDRHVFPLTSYTDNGKISVIGFAP